MKKFSFLPYSLVILPGHLHRVAAFSARCFSARCFSARWFHSTIKAASLALICGFTALGAYASGPNVVVSIAPVHSLVSDLMQGVGAPVLLIEGGQSPHSSYLPPSAHRKIENADLLVWIGPTFETSLRKPFQQFKPSDRVISLMANKQIRKLPVRDSGVWQAEHDQHDHGTVAHSNELDLDPHLWLSTENAIQIATVLTAELSRIDPDRAEIYRTNKKQLIAKIDTLHGSLMLNLAPMADIPYLVFHDAYHYFEDEYGLHPAGAVTLDPGRKPGAKSVHLIEQLIRDRGVQCLFSEPQFEPGLLKRLVEDTDIKAGVLDPLGSDIKPGSGQWFALMQAMSDGLLTCIE